jgi:flagellar assembly protein FliH
MSEQNTNDLIHELLKRKDPAIVGLKKILRQKANVAEDQSFHTHAPEVFNAGTSQKSQENETIFSDSEKRVIELEEQLLIHRSEVESLVKQMEEEKVAAYEAGVEDGKTKALQESAGATAEESDALAKEYQEKLVGIIENEIVVRTQFFSEVEKDLLKLSLKIAKKIIDAEIKSNPEIIITTIKKALSYIADRTEISIFVSPEERAFVHDKIHEFNERNDDMLTAFVLEREAVEPGGTIIESPSGIVDARISKQLSELEEIVNQSWQEFSDSQNSGLDESLDDATTV